MRLDKREQVAFINQLVELAKSDGNIDSSEAEIILEYAEKHSEAYYLSKWITNDEAEETLALMPMAKKIHVLNELERLSLSDGYLSFQEITKVLHIAKVLGIDTNLVVEHYKSEVYADV